LPPQGKHRSKIPSKEEEARVLETVERMSPSDALIFWLMGKRGLRIGEIVGNHRNGSNLPGLQIEDLTDSGVHVKGKKGHDDFIPLPPEIIVKLRQQTIRGKQPAKTGLIFYDVGSHQDPVGTMDHRTKVYCREAGIEDSHYVHPHAFRHAFGFKVARMTNGDSYKVRDFMRHKNIAMSSRYVHGMSPEEHKATLTQMDLET